MSDRDGDGPPGVLLPEGGLGPPTDAFPNGRHEARGATLGLHDELRDLLGPIRRRANTLPSRSTKARPEVPETGRAGASRGRVLNPPRGWSPSSARLVRCGGSRLGEFFEIERTRAPRRRLHDRRSQLRLALWSSWSTRREELGPRRQYLEAEARDLPGESDEIPPRPVT